MKILVAVTDVGVVDDAFEVRDGSIPPEYLTYELNEWDEYALESAVQLAEAGEAEEVVTVTVGPDRSDETIRKALAKGADRAIRIWDDVLADRDFVDSRAKSRVLASLVSREEPSLVLTGVQSGQDMFGATGVGLAAALDYAWAAVVTDIELADGELAVHRELEGGQVELASISLPAVCTIQTGINEPRYASLRGIRMAQRSEIETLELADLGLEPDILDTGLDRVDMARPIVESSAEIYEGSPDDTATALAAFLRDRGVESE